MNSIILGFTGPLGSGATFISKGIEEFFGDGFKYYCLSEFIVQELRTRGNTNPKIQDKQDVGNELREKHGPAVLAFELMKRLSEEGGGKRGSVIDGIKNAAEVRALRQWPNFYLFSIQADKENRRTRCLKMNKFDSPEEFDFADKRDQYEQFEHGQQVTRCDYMADIVVVNNVDIPDHDHTSKREFIRKIHDHYIDLALESQKTEEQVLSGRRAPELDEVCMTMAYSISKRSSCIKRQVGAVIVELDRATENDNHSVNEIPFIVSNGFNEVPLGLKKCIYNADFQMCYRDHLQEEHAREIKFCPNCGEKVRFELKCSCGEIHNEYKKWCRKCNRELNPPPRCSCTKDIFSTYVPGGKDSPGKLLDMCRALHAEEMALLQLAKISRVTNENLILYCTTQPCNLCANKIVAAGIKNVVYAEPYSMKDAEDILKKGGVETRRFQGVKSSAFFRLYR